jgi:hypothetical protein
VAAVFALNTATFLLYAIVVACHPRLGGTPQSPGRFLPGLRAGGRDVRHAPVVRRVLLRAALFLVPGSALWALLPLIATSRLGFGPGGYGVLLGALGVGAVGGAFILPQIRARLSANALAAAASLTYAAALAAVALSRSLALTIVVLLPAGVAWIAFLSNVNAALQLFLPRWVRARGLSAYQMVLFGAQAAGAAIWGVVAGAAGLVPAFLISAAVMAAGAATIWFWPFHQIADMDRSLVRWPEAQLLISADRGSGLVLVRTTYTIAAERSSSSCRPWPACASRGGGPGPPAVGCTRTARTRACSSSYSASRAGKSTSGSTGSGKPAPISSTTTTPRPYRTRRRKPATTWPPTSASSQSPGHHPTCPATAPGAHPGTPPRRFTHGVALGRLDQVHEIGDVRNGPLLQLWPAMRPSRCRPGNEIEVSQSRLPRWLSKTRPNGRFVAVAGPRVLEISDLGSLCPASARVRLGLAGVAGVPVMARVA